MRMSQFQNRSFNRVPIGPRAVDAGFARAAGHAVKRRAGLPVSNICISIFEFVSDFDIRISCFLAAFVLGCLPLRADDLARQQEQASLMQFRDQVRPLLLRYCADCHGQKKQNAEIRFDQLDPNMAAGDDGETWHDALNELNQGDMPPEKADQPKPAEREILIGWLTAELKRATAVRRSTGGRVVMRRLTRYEYANTMRDLFGFADNFAKDLPPEPASPDGFQNNGKSLGMSPLQIEHYLNTARRALEKAIVVGDQPELVRFENDSIGGEGYGQGSERQIPSAGMMKFPSSPLEGPFRLLVTASAERVSGIEPPVIGVHLGYRNSPNNFSIKLVGETRLTGTQDKPQTFELRGRMENFPHPDPTTPLKERRNPGLRIGFSNSYYAKYPAGIVMAKWAPSAEKKKPRTAEERLARDAVENTQPGEEGMPRIKIHSVVYEAPYYDVWPPKHHTRILFDSPLRDSDETAYARKVIERFMRRAFRRPVTTEEVDRLMRVYDDLVGRALLPVGSENVEDKETGKSARPTLSIELAMREVLAEVLVAPEFLYLMEPTSDSKRQPLTDHELAVRLSYLLWSTMPDDELIAAADEGRLKDDAYLEGIVRRMLEDERSWNFIENFTDQWLNLDELNRIAINPEFYPGFDSLLKRDMRLETQHFFAEILHRDLSVFNLIDSDFTMLNRAMANHYGLQGPRSSRFERVALRPEDHRGGLLGQASILLRNSNGEDSHPILRGAWIKDRLLGDPPASPPPDVPDLEKDNPDLAKLSLKKQLEFHRQKTSCNDCHQEIDPWGVPLEHFDAIGRWRTERLALVPRKKGPGKRLEVSDSPIEAGSQLSNGEEISGFVALKSYLRHQEKDRFVRAFVQRLLTYALGRNLEVIDEETVNQLVAEFAAADYQIDELLVAITKSKTFRTK